jgi:hypothetical protein
MLSFRHSLPPSIRVSVRPRSRTRTPTLPSEGIANVPVGVFEMIRSSDSLILSQKDMPLELAHKGNQPMSKTYFDLDLLPNPFYIVGV